MKVVIAAHGNPDYTYPCHRRDVRILPRLVDCKDLEDASRICRKFIDENELGAGNWADPCGWVYDGDEIVANVSYNGRVWEPGSCFDEHGKYIPSSLEGAREERA